MLENTNEPEVTYVGNYRGQTRAESKFVIIVAVASIVLSFVFFRHFISPDLLVYSPMSDTTATMRLCIVEYSVNKAFFPILTADMLVYIKNCSYWLPSY